MMQKRLPLVLVPGLLNTERLFAAQISALGGFLDLSVADHRLHDDMAMIAEHILDNAPERFALAGLSMGGYIALEIMRQAPHRVDRLALLNTSPLADDAVQEKNRHAFIRLASCGKFHKVAPLMMPGLLADDGLDNHDLVTIVQEMADETGVEAFIRQQRANMSRRDARDLLATITCPTLVLVGDQDELTPPDIAEDMAAAIPHAHLVIIENCGHLSPLEQPEAVSVALGEWLLRSPAD